MTAECKDFIEKCLKKSPAERLGTKNDVKEIISHAWFSDININDLLARKIVPDFKPKLSNDVLDVSNFDKSFTSDEAVHSVLPQNTQKKIMKNNDKFKGFDA